MNRLYNAVLVCLLLLGQYAEAFDHVNYCGEMCKMGYCAKIRIHVHNQDKVHVYISGGAQIDKDFHIYKKQGKRFWIRVCSETGYLCKEEYELYDNRDHIQIDVHSWVGDINGKLEQCNLPTSHS